VDTSKHEGAEEVRASAAEFTVEAAEKLHLLERGVNVELRRLALERAAQQAKPGERILITPEHLDWALKYLIGHPDVRAAPRERMRYRILVSVSLTAALASFLWLSDLHGVVRYLALGIPLVLAGYLVRLVLFAGK
jgi:hypothetical protein